MNVKRLKDGFLCLTVLVCGPLWSQVVPSATGGAYPPNDDLKMSIPPALNGAAYPTKVGSEVRSNYIQAGLGFTAAYTDNLMNIQSTHEVSDEIFSILPSIGLDRKTPRQTQELHYGGGFSFYNHTTDLNDVTQNATADYELNLSRYATISLRDTFNQNSNSFNQTAPLTGGGGISGSPQSPSNVLVVPFLNQLTNYVSGGFAYQFARNAMIGGSGSYGLLHYENPGSVEGLTNSDEIGASAFFSRRVSRTQYFGGEYAYSRFSTHPIDSTTDTNAIFLFYSVYLSKELSLTVMAGPQYFNASQPPFPSTSGWTPAVSASAGWQSARTNLVGSYSRIVFSGGGLTGAYYSNEAAASFRRLVTRSWGFGVNGNYSNLRSATPIYTTSNQGGHTWSGTASIQYRISESLNSELGYGHFYQNYNVVQSVSNFPNSNRVFGSINYQLTRPLGR